MIWFKTIAMLLLVLVAVISLVSCNGVLVYHDEWAPPPPGPNWVPGHWSWGDGDWVWIGGHWRP
jgi:hypothetical protein